MTAAKDRETLHNMSSQNRTSASDEPPKLSLKPANLGANFKVNAAMTSRGRSN